MLGFKKGIKVQYSVKQKLTDAVDERTGRRWRSPGMTGEAMMIEQLMKIAESGQIYESEDPEECRNGTF